MLIEFDIWVDVKWVAVEVIIETGVLLVAELVVSVKFVV